jgi:hypothetical protein
VLHRNNQSIITEQSSRTNWTSDGKNGPTDPTTLMKILLDWILTEGNYSRYRGKNNDGARKVEFANKIARLMNETKKV